MELKTHNRRELRTRNPIRPPDGKGGSLAYLTAVAIALAALVVACDQLGAALR